MESAALERRIAVIPVKDHHWALSKSAVEETCNAIAWVHSTAGLVSPTTSPFVKTTLEGLQR